MKKSTNVFLALAVCVSLAGCRTPQAKELPSRGALTEEQEAIIRKLKTLGPEGSYGFIFTALDHSQADAERYLSAAVSLYPDNQKLGLLQAVCARSRWRKTEAALQLARVMAIDAESVEGQCARLMLALDRGTNAEKPIESLRDLIHDNPDNPLLLWVMGIACRESFVRDLRSTYSQEGAEAYANFAQHFMLGPVMLHHTYANVLSEGLDRHDEALKHRLIAVRLEPRRWSYEGLGNTLVKLNRREEAYRAFEEAIRLDPDNGRTYRSWGQALRDEGRCMDAIAKFRKSTDLNPWDLATWYEWARCLYLDERYSEALPLLEKSARGGYPLATGLMGAMYELGQGVITNLAVAVDYYQRAAAAGDGWSMNRLGNLYSQGKGVEPDASLALRWYTEGAEAGNADSAASAGMMYYNARGVPHDEKRAFNLCLQGAHARPPSMAALRHVIFSYQTGKGVTKDLAKATEYGLIAARNGIADCMVFAGNAYEMGKFVPRDLAEALRWYKAGMAGGDQSLGNRAPAARIMATAPDAQLWNGPAAVALVASTPPVDATRDWALLDTIAAAYARNGQFKEAAETERKALAVMEELRAMNNSLLTPRLDKWTPSFQARLKLYETGQPYADPPYDPSRGGQNPNPLSDLFW